MDPLLVGRHLCQWKTTTSPPALLSEGSMGLGYQNVHTCDAGEGDVGFVDVPLQRNMHLRWRKAG
jgi:hypothetical protein